MYNIQSFIYLSTLNDIARIGKSMGSIADISISEGPRQTLIFVHRTDTPWMGMSKLILPSALFDK